MDNFEDFEFRPLTDGLGFHKKSNSAKIEATETEKFAEEKISANIGFELPELKLDTRSSIAQEIRPQEISKEPTSNIFTQQPLPREGELPKKTIKKQELKIPKFQGPKFSKITTEKANEAAAQVAAAPLSNKIDTQVQFKYIETPASLLSMFLDSTVIAGLAILFALGLSMATQVDLVRVLSQGMDLGIQIGLFLLIYSVSQIYYILSRVFFGQTLGEWALENQIGLNEEQEKVSYIFRICWRNIILTATGFIILPIISSLFNKDLVGKMSGLKMYRQEQV